MSVVCALLAWGCASSAPNEPAAVAPPTPVAPSPRRHPTLPSTQPNVWDEAKAPTAPTPASAGPERAQQLTVEIGRAKLPYAQAEAWRHVVARAGETTRPNAPRVSNGSDAGALGPSFKPLRTISFGKSHLTFAELSDDGRWVVAASEAEGVLRQYDATSGKLLSKLAVPGFEPYGRSSFLSWPLEHSRPLVLEVNEQGHRLLDVAEGTVVQVDTEPGWSLRLSESERFVGSALARIPAQTSTLRFARPTPEPALEPVMTLELAERADDWVLTRDERLLALLFYPSDQIEILDLLGQRVVGVLDAPQYAASIDVTPDERFLAVGGAALWVYDLTTGERVATDERFDNNIGYVGFSPSGDRLVVTAYDGRARSYVFADGHLGERQVLPHRGTANVYAASFSGDGRRLVTSSGDQTLKVWER